MRIWILKSWCQFLESSFAKPFHPPVRSQLAFPDSLWSCPPPRTSCQVATNSWLKHISSLFGALFPRHHLALATGSSEHISSGKKAIHHEETPGVTDPGESCFRRQGVLSSLVSSLILRVFENRLIETVYLLIIYGLKYKELSMLFNNLKIIEERRTQSLTCQQFQPWRVKTRGSCSFLRLPLYWLSIVNWASSEGLLDKLPAEEKRQLDTSNSGAFWKQQKKLSQSLVVNFSALPLLETGKSS